MRRTAVSFMIAGLMMALLLSATPISFAANWADITNGLHGAFVSNDQHYSKTVCPSVPETHNWSGAGWKGERLNTEILLWTKDGVNQVAYSATALADGLGNTIPSSNVVMNFMKYVTSDDGANGCGDNRTRPTQLIADVLDTVTQVNVAAQNCQPLWVAVNVPSTVATGVYQGQITVSYSGGSSIVFPISVEVLNVTLPAVASWVYHHDHWQNPWAVSRYYGVTPWSQSHWNYLQPLLQMAQQGGQKVITTTLNKDPWGSPTYDAFGTMIVWTKHSNGTWTYDYTIFDNYVQTCLNLGINKYINCYSMVPWNGTIYYYDEATAREVSVSLAPGSSQYNSYWQPFLVDFKTHLQLKGWFNLTNVAMDERSLSDMQAVINLVKSAAPGLGIALAGGWYPSIAGDVRDYCIAFGGIPGDITSIAASRRQVGQNTTFYVCCADPHPNDFVYSPSAENVWLGWYAAKMKVDGTLRWAFNSWVADPLVDTRHWAYQSGDCFMVYPGCSSVRWERLREGIQDNEKICYLRANLPSGWLNELESMVSSFTPGQDYTATVNSGKQQLDYIVRNWLAGNSLPVVVNDTATGTGNNQFDYHGNWSTATGPAAYMLDDHFSKNTNDYYQVRFNGAQIKGYAAKGANIGIGAYSMDGGAETNVDCYAAARQDQVLLYSSPILASGQHTLKVRVTGTKNGGSSDYFITADKVEIFSAGAATPTPAPTPTPGATATPTPAPTPTTAVTATPTPTAVPAVVNDATTGTGNNQFDYHGNWPTSTGPAPYQQDDHYSNTTNDYYLVRFNGTQIKVYAAKGTNIGIGAYSMDGGAETNVDGYNSSRLDQVLLYTSPVLTVGQHSLKVRVTGTKNGSSTNYFITADKVEIFN
jgi:hypothetical protein